MLPHYLLRVGIDGTVGSFRALEPLSLARRTRVVCRTNRGLEVGEVLADDPDCRPAIGDLIRKVTVEDDLLLARLERGKLLAFDECCRWLEERGITIPLVDVEHLLDGQSLYFHFLGEVTPDIEAITVELAEVYEFHAQFRRFTETLTAGCGPGCGTDEAERGCSTGHCSTCAVACATRR